MNAKPKTQVEGKSIRETTTVMHGLTAILVKNLTEEDTLLRTAAKGTVAIGALVGSQYVGTLTMLKEWLQVASMFMGFVVATLTAISLTFGLWQKWRRRNLPPDIGLVLACGLFIMVFFVGCASVEKIMFDRADEIQVMTQIQPDGSVQTIRQTNSAVTVNPMLVDFYRKRIKKQGAAN